MAEFRSFVANWARDDSRALLILEPTRLSSRVPYFAPIYPGRAHDLRYTHAPLPIP